MTQLEQARKGNITPEMVSAAAREKILPETLCERIALGHVVIPANIRHPEQEHR